MRKAITALLPLLKFYPWAIPVVILLGILSSLLEGFGISLFIPLLQGLDPSSSVAASDPFSNLLNQLFAGVPSIYRFTAIALCVFSSILLKNGLVYANSVVSAWLNSRISHRLRSGLFDQLLSVSYRFLETHESGQLVNVLATETWQTSRALAVLIGFIICICTIAVFVVFLLLISWRLTLLVTLVVLLISLTIQFVTRQAKHLGQQAVQANTLLATRMWEGLGGMRVIRSFGREHYEQERFDRASVNVQNTFFKLDCLSGVVNPLSEVLSAGLILCILMIALSQNQASLPALLTFLFILYRLQPQVKQLDGMRVGLAAMTGSVQAVMSLLDRTDKSYIQSGVTPFQKLQRSIAFEAVGFRYSETDPPAVQDISICIPKGKTTALVGTSGAGKSTLISLLCRLYEPTSGEIYVDGLLLPQLNLEDWRKQIAIVSQDIYLFSASIRENIAYGRLTATDDEIIAAAKLANAHEFISQLPQGYATPVGDRGMRLSGGQKQRIALARAIVRDPEILILDEATNALDSIAETLIQEALEQLSYNRTVIVIAHRLSTIEQADQIIVMQSGRVVEQGNLQNLLKRNGLFTKLYRLQHRNAHT